VEKTFRYDDGFAIDALGANNSDAMLGAAHYENSIVEEISWYLTDVSVSHQTVNIVIMGLSADGSPDNNNILFQQNSVANIDMQWNYYTFPEPIIAENGFYIGLNYDGFLSLAMDNGEGAPYEFIPGTHWVSFDWTNPNEWGRLEDAGFENNFLLRAHGYSLGTLDRGTHVVNSSFAHKDDFVKVSLNDAIDTRSTARHEFFINEYNLYLDGELIEEGFAERVYTISGIANGSHVFGVTAIYDNFIESEIVEIEFEYYGNDNADVSALAKPYINNYPNPFNPNTNIQFNLKKDGPVSLIIYNIKGQKVAQLVNENLKSGVHNISWDGKSSSGARVGSGVYFYQLQTNYDKRIGKMMLMK